VKTSEIRDKSDEELAQLEIELRDKLVKLEVARATQRAVNTAQFPRIKKDIARVKTIQHERKLGLGGRGAGAGEGATT
jgi:large subunit ribosomal protein L29